MLAIFLAIIPIFLLIVTGYVARNWFLPDEVFWKSAEKFTYYVFFPALLVLKICESDFSGNASTSALLATIGATAAVGLVVFATRLFVPMKDDLFTSVFQGGVRYNSYVFIAMSQALFGALGVAASGIFVAYMIVVTNVAAVLVLNHYGHASKKTPGSMVRSLAANPLILGALGGFVLNKIGFKPAGFLGAYLHYLADAATPLSLLAAGAGLNLVMHRRKVVATAYSSVLKLVAMPLFTALLLKFFGVTGIMANVAVLYAAVPCAGNAYILSRQMGGDSETMASIITWTTLLSIITITLLLAYVRF